MLPVSPTGDRVKVEVILRWVFGDVVYPAREGDQSVRGLHKDTMHVLHVCYPTFVSGAWARILGAVIEETSRIFATKVDNGRPLSHIAVAITRVVNMRCDQAGSATENHCRTCHGTISTQV